MITLDNLKHFSATLEHKGVLRAAEKLFISPSSITRSIKIIEEELGTELFRKVGRGLEATQEGLDFNLKTQEVLRSYESLFHRSGEPTALRGHYQLGASHFLGEHLLAKLCMGLQEAHPDITLETQCLDSNQLMTKVHQGRVDLGLVFSPKKSPEMGGQVVHEGSLRLCVRKGHILAGKAFSTVANRISEYPATIHRPTDSIERCDNHPMFKTHGIQPEVTSYWDSDYFAKEVLAQTDAWSLLPDYIIERCPEIVELRHPKDWHAPYTIELIWKKDRIQPPLREACAMILSGS